MVAALCSASTLNKAMKSDARIPDSTREIFARLWLLFAVLVAAAVTGCAVESTEPVAVAQAIDSAPVVQKLTDTTVQGTAGVLQSAETPTNTTTPTTIPTLTPLPTASETATATSSPTVSPSETLVSVESITTALTVTAVSAAQVEPTSAPPLPTPAGVYSWTLKVPILMYHYISEPPRDADKYRRDLSVTPRSFEEQMAYLAENGFESVDLYDLSLAITAKRELPEKPVIITFDDGYRDNFENAFPILQDHGMKATFFIITDFIDEQREGYLSWEMVEEMAGAGMRIESHSKTHPDLSTSERDYVIYEALGSQETIAAHIGYTPRYFCYPSGRYSEETMAILNELGYWGALTTADGSWHGYDDRFEWSRNRMRHTTTLAEFANLVSPTGTISGKRPDDG